MNNYGIVDYLNSKRRPIIFILMVLVILFLFSHFSFISISASGQDNASETSFQLVNQHSAQAVTKKTKDGKTTRLVSRGSYDVLVKNGAKSYFTVVKAGGFFTKKTVDAKLANQKKREYVGNGPAGCTFYSAEVLYSYDCPGTSLITTHVAATEAVPTYTIKSDTAMGVIKGVVHTKEGVVVIAQVATTEDGQYSPYRAYVLSGGLSSSSSTDLGDLEKSTGYSFAPYKDGFIAYDIAFYKLLYYANSKSKPESIATVQPKDSGLKPVSISAHGNSIVATYSNAVEAPDENLVNVYSDKIDVAANKNKKVVKVKPLTKFVVYRDGKSQEYGQKRYFSVVQACGTNKICALDSDSKRSLLVYDASGKKLSLLYTLTGGKMIKSTDSSLLIVRDSEVLGFDTDSRSGTVQYSYEGLRFCGIDDDQNDYILCIIDNHSQVVALRITQNQDDTGGIDRKIQQLQNIPEVIGVSAYKNRLFVSLEVGNDVYVPELQSYGFDRAVQRTALAAVNKKVSELRIDKNSYSIVPVPSE